MKNTLILFLLILFLLSNCKKVDLAKQPIIPVCEFGSKEYINFYDLKLRHPDGLSAAHLNSIPIDKIYRNLESVFEGHGAADYASSIIKGKVISDGSFCKGFEKFKFEKGDKKISGSTLQIPFVSNSGFKGEVSVKMRSPTFYNEKGSASYYYVLWEKSSNELNNIVGDITGKKMTINSLKKSRKEPRVFYAQKDNPEIMVEGEPIPMGKATEKDLNEEVTEEAEG
ncbi:hypothetical protein [Polaribacter cellanae]|uniref:Uncharacterized protein n=1 Tax=Polaribacter cellanae TaxID=2818493 RepID=A0A975H887_9FLAO|nr:hypothetical protein [Polaribacter cellanae]QTE23848.1 hypothetical protein J3359_06155 [Polaribacter cellanae]